MAEQTFQTQIEEMNQKIEDLEHNKDVQALETRNLREKILNQEKRIVWCEENIKANGEHTKANKAGTRK